MPFRNTNVPKPLKLPKGKLTKIDWGDKEQQVKEIWESKKYTSLSYKSMACRMNKIKALFGYDGSNLIGYCSKCRELNSYILRQKVEGAILITRFCEEHVPT